jgi:hypothetical protein
LRATDTAELFQRAFSAATAAVTMACTCSSSARSTSALLERRSTCMVACAAMAVTPVPPAITPTLNEVLGSAGVSISAMRATARPRA